MQRTIHHTVSVILHLILISNVIEVTTNCNCRFPGTKIFPFGKFIKAVTFILLHDSLGGQYGGCVLVMRRYFSSNTVVIPMSGAANVHDRVSEFA